MKKQARKIVNQLIKDRKERLERIEIKSEAEELLELCREPDFFSTPLREVDERAVKDNKETDKEMKEWALNF